MALIKLLSWNICFGGIGADLTEYDQATSGENLIRISRAIIDKNPDIVMLQEYRDADKTGGLIKDNLYGAGFTCYCSNLGMDKNGILIALSRKMTGLFTILPVDSFRVDKKRLDEIYRYRWLNLELVSDRLTFELLGLHIPDVRPGRKGGPETFVKSLGHKQLIWDALIDYAREKLNKNCEAVIAGDFNTGVNAEDQSQDSGSYYLSDRMMILKELKNRYNHGLVDAWRKYHPEPGPEDYTWFFDRSGFRLDYLFFTPELGERLEAIEYSHEERLERLSDHSIILADMRI